MSAAACCTDLVGASPTPVGAEAPGSRLPARGETRPVEAQRQKPPWEGANEQAVTLVNATASSVLQPKGVRESRVAHVTTKATHIDLVSERSVGFPGARAAACSERAVRNWRGPPRQPASGKDQGYKPGGESSWSREGVRGARSTVEAVHENAVEGRGPPHAGLAGRLRGRAALAGRLAGGLPRSARAARFATPSGSASVASVVEVSVRACRKASNPLGNPHV